MILLPLLILTLSGLTIQLALPDQFRVWIEPTASAAAVSSSKVNGRIVYTRSGSGGLDIFLMYGDGSGQVNITNYQGDDSEPDWSPDGKKIAFASRRDNAGRKIYVMNDDGSQPTKITNGAGEDGYPNWSPDGQKILFGRYGVTNGSGLYVVKADGTELLRLTTNPMDYAAVWSPDGTKIAFANSDADGNRSIYVASATGRGRVKITHDIANNSMPAWSPDGTKIAFMSNRDTPNYSQIFVMDADGGNPTRLTNVDRGDAGYPSWSADGTKIIFHRYPEGSWDNEIYTMNPDGTDQVNITNSPTYETDADWEALPENPAGYLKLNAARYNVIEDIGTATMTVARIGGSTGEITVDYTTTQVTARKNLDYAHTSGTLTFAEGETVKTISVPVFEDAVTERDETLSITLSNPTDGSALMQPLAAVLNIIDSSHLPVLSAGGASVNEADSGSTNTVLKVSMSAATGQVVTVNYIATGISARKGADFQALSGKLTFNPGETEKTVTVSVLNDLLDEVDETFYLALSNPTHAALPTSGNPQVVTIFDNDPEPTVSVNDVTVTEGDTGTVNAVFTVTLSAASGKTVTLRYQAFPGIGYGGADTPEDFRETYGTFSLAPGVRTKSITVPVRGDLVFEGTETFFLNVAGENSSQTLAKGVCTILDNDVPPTMSILDAKIVEGNTGTSTMRVTVKLSAPSTEQAGALFKVTRGTATANVDYRPVGGGILIYPGMTVDYIEVPIIGDRLKEADETFIITLSDPQNIKIADGRGDYTIIDND